VRAEVRKTISSACRRSAAIKCPSKMILEGRGRMPREVLLEVAVKDVSSFLGDSLRPDDANHRREIEAFEVKLSNRPFSDEEQSWGGNTTVPRPGSDPVTDLCCPPRLTGTFHADSTEELTRSPVGDREGKRLLLTEVVMRADPGPGVFAGVRRQDLCSPPRDFPRPGRPP
jgi:hypothetical protein